MSATTSPDAPDIADASVAAPVASRARDHYFDTLRMVAILRVFVYHALGFAWIPVLLPSVPVMLGLAGSLMAGSLDRSSGPRVVRSRLRRLLPPLWVFGAVAVPVMLVLGWPGVTFLDVAWWVLPLTDPPGSDAAEPLWSALWYLRAYLWLVLLSPALRWLFRRWPWPALLLPVAATVLLTSPLVSTSGPAGVVVWGIATYGTCWLLGFAAHDGLLARVRPWLCLAAAATLAGGGLAWALTHPDDSDPALFADPMGDALWSAAFVLVLLRFRPRMDWLGRLPWLARFVAGFNARAVTVYIWHLPALFAAEAMLSVALGEYEVPLALWFGMVLLVGAALTVAAVLLVGWVEDIAARRRPAFLPR